MISVVILFTGHRIDEPNRNRPRFPPECEPAARSAIRSALTDILAMAGGPILGIAGAADGADILFHEICAELGIMSEVCLALPPEEYIQTSVQPLWRERFLYLLEAHPTVTMSPTSGDIWEQDHHWQIRRARDQHSKRAVLLAFLDRNAQEIQGGTAAMVQLAQAAGLEIMPLDASEICNGNQI